MILETLQSKLDGLPHRSGCYIFRDPTGQVLYVGKATSLRSRVRSYFQEGSSDDRSFLPLLRRNVADLETVVTASEKEATILEASLVKQLKPRYNIKLRDDKSYLCLRLDFSHPFPRLELVRRPSPDGARYFGPYHSATAARRTLQFINKHFQLRTCTNTEFQSRKRTCLQYDIKRCPGPCVLDVDRDCYGANVQAVGLLLEGRHDEVLRQVERRMKDSSAHMDYEQAAVFRDQLAALRLVRESQRVVAVCDLDQDVLGLHRDGDHCEIGIAFVRSGRVVETASYPIRKVEVPDQEVIAGFLAQFYGEEGPAAHTIPDEIVVPILPDGAVGVSDWLSDRRGAKVRLLAPKRGVRLRLLQLATENASHAFEEKRRGLRDLEDRLVDIQAKLRLPAVPRVIECCDISHLEGGDTVGGLIRMVDGEPAKQGYRSYHVRAVADGDDYAAMFEVLSRRFRRGSGDRTDSVQPNPEDGSGMGPALASDNPTANQSNGWELPDLLVIDGGRGQLNVALAAANDLGLHDLPIVALAKERESASGETLTDRVYLPGQKNGIPVRPNTALGILAYARDEAHRFANRTRVKLGTARRLRSQLEDIPGIGKATRQRLLQHFDGISAIEEASDAAILAVPGVTRRHLSALRHYFRPANEPSADGSAQSGQRNDVKGESDLATLCESE